MSTNLQQSLRSYSEDYQTYSRLLQAFSNIYYTPTVAFQIPIILRQSLRSLNGGAKSVLPYNSLCVARVRAKECLQTFDSLC